MCRRRKYDLTESWLRSKYVEGGLSQKDLADLAGCHPMTISRALREAGISTRGRGATNGMSTQERFLHYVDKKGPNECWNWKGYIDSDWGYGHFGGIEGRQWGAHRIAWALHTRTWPIPMGRMVCHTCGNPACVNPAHLYLGDAATNMQDRSPLEPQDVWDIRCLYATGKYTYEQLGDKFGVAPSTVSCIVLGFSWATLKDKED